MTQFIQRALALALALAATGLSCADDDDPDPGPTQEEMQQVASDYCEKVITCGFNPPDVTLEECIANQVGTYQDAPECVARYDLDECLTTQTCEEMDRLEQLGVGDCLDERDEASNVLCSPPPQ